MLRTGDILLSAESKQRPILTRKSRKLTTPGQTRHYSPEWDLQALNSSVFNVVMVPLAGNQDENKGDELGTTQLVLSVFAEKS